MVDFQFQKTYTFLDLIIKLYVAGFLLPFVLSITFESVFIKNLSYIACFITQVFLFLFELVQMRQYGLEYFQDFWNLIDITQFVSFMFLFINKLATQFSSDSGFEIFLSAAILFLSIYKILYFVRIYDGANHFLTVVSCVVADLKFFILISFALIFGVAKIYQVLHLGVNDPDQVYSQIGSDFIKLFMQTYKLSSGDKTPPALDTQMADRLKGSASQGVFMFFLTFVWAVQQLASGMIIMTAYGLVLQSCEKNARILSLLKTRTRAKFNEENFQIMNLIRAQPTFKAVFFQIDKNIKKDKINMYEGTAASIEKHMEQAENTKMTIAADEDAQRAAQAKLLAKSIDMIDDLAREVKKLNDKCSS